ncbi:polyisoprenoid-binding protein [Bowdeniella nasicola]|uniref:Polyisoprenoid-binding protein n=1 Tax=Bowdeniella nasicola TaxID=208480 RepID=A0A1Q5Q0Q6_9ACTO|nr:YceI family protein [Bowdeniella nasicola]OKL53451.1 polyisoprenoid-binding protein [Bowdeniella nasicola]
MANLNDLTGTWTLDPSHSEIGFVARHAMVTKVRGSFTDVAGTADFNSGVNGGSINVTVQVASVDTRNADRDAHLRSEDFFDAEKYPIITFASSEVKALDATTLEVTGDLTIKDVPKPVTIEFDYQGVVTDPWGNERAGLEGSVVVNRKDFGLTWNASLDAGGVLVSEKITLQFEVSATKNA